MNGLINHFVKTAETTERDVVNLPRCESEDSSESENESRPWENHKNVFWQMIANLIMKWNIKKRIIAQVKRTLWGSLTVHRRDKTLIQLKALRNIFLIVSRNCNLKLYHSKLKFDLNKKLVRSSWAFCALKTICTLNSPGSFSRSVMLLVSTSLPAPSAAKREAKSFFINVMSVN